MVRKSAIGSPFRKFELRARGRTRELDEKLAQMPDNPIYKGIRELLEMPDNAIDVMLRANLAQRLEPDLVERFMVKLAEKRWKVIGPSRATH